MEAFGIFVIGEIWSCEDLLDETEDLSDRESEAWVVVPVVPDVPVSPSSVVTGFCDGFSCCSDWDFLEPAVLFLLQRSVPYSCTVTQEEMRFEEPQVKAPPLSRRRMRPPTPLQNSYSSFEKEQANFEVEDQMWIAKDGTIIAKTKQ